MSLLLPTWQLCIEQKPVAPPKDSTSSKSNLSYEMAEMERLTQTFTAQLHWELSTTLTSNHLLTIIALANTLMSMNNASFVAEQERNRKLQRYCGKLSVGNLKQNTNVSVFSYILQFDTSSNNRIEIPTEFEIC